MRSTSIVFRSQLPTVVFHSFIASTSGSRGDGALAQAPRQRASGDHLVASRIVGPRGGVIVYNNGGYASYVGKELAERFQGRRVPHTLLKVAEIADLKLPAHLLDAALFVMSYHDVYYTPKGAKGPMGDAGQMVGCGDSRSRLAGRTPTFVW